MKLSEILKPKAPAPVNASSAPESPAPVPQTTMPPETTCRFCGRHFTVIPQSRHCPVCCKVIEAPGRDQPLIPTQIMRNNWNASSAPESPAPVPQTTMPPETTCRFCGCHFTVIPQSRHCPICCTVSEAPGHDQPLIPTQIAWNEQTCVLIDLNALPSDDTLIVVASSEYSFTACHQLRRVGHATYESSAFGWMERRKTGDVFCIDRSSRLSDDALRTAAKSFGLLPNQYQSANLAFLTEESSWSNCCIEVAAITGNRAEVLSRCCGSTRYDILISEITRNYYPPRLISLALYE